MVRSHALVPRWPALVGCALALVLVLACGGGEARGGAEPGEPAAAPEGAGAAAQQPAAEGAADFGTLSSRGTPASDGGTAVAGAAGLQFELPAAWRQQTPSSSMRLAQAQIPGPGGPGELTVFFFGPGGGGGREANIERWVGQMEARDAPRRESFESHGLTITWVDVSGTMKPSTMGMGPAEPQPGYRLFGAVVEGPGGPWFFKATGPEATLEAEREEFLALLANLRPAA